MVGGCCLICDQAWGCLLGLALLELPTVSTMLGEGIAPSSSTVSLVSKKKVIVSRISVYKVHPEATHFMMPWFERPTIYDVRAS
ncbi:hypothetical protein DM860_017833 [Cuscuta australis]|uniref:Prohibitin n=1 Tax=Cuscuta australis TaxID=267555 RepID=A0A328DQV8_9ASTE|nr:hypothetical protein DM860_017833 [Cuscuta australis]